VPIARFAAISTQPAEASPYDAIARTSSDWTGSSSKPPRSFAEALHATGAHDAARRALADARARLLAIADKIADPDYKTSFLERVPEHARTLALATALGDPDGG